MHPINDVDGKSRFGLPHRPGRRAFSAVLPLLLLVGCGSSPDGSPSPAATVPQGTTAPKGSYTVEGEVFAFATGMIGAASVNLWVQQEKFGYSYWWANGPLASDGIGRFTADNLPASQITILAFASDHVQPCAVRIQVPSDAPVRVELVPTPTFDALNPPRPQLSTEPSVTGEIYEITATGREPIAGVNLWVEEVMDTGIATTLSDLGGRFYLCNLGRAAYLHLSKPGFQPTWVGPIDASVESQTLEIQLMRL